MSPLLYQLSYTARKDGTQSGQDTGMVWRVSTVGTDSFWRDHQVIKEYDSSAPTPMLVLHPCSGRLAA
jgi:hypothetical protein